MNTAQSRQVVVVDEGHDTAGDGAEHDEQQLLGGERVVVRGPGAAGGAEHHEQSEHGHAPDRREQHPVDVAPRCRLVAPQRRHGPVGAAQRHQFAPPVGLGPDVVVSPVAPGWAVVVGPWPNTVVSGTLPGVGTPPRIVVVVVDDGASVVAVGGASHGIVGATTGEGPRGGQRLEQLVHHRSGVHGTEARLLDDGRWRPIAGSAQVRSPRTRRCRSAPGWSAPYRSCRPRRTWSCRCCRTRRRRCRTRLRHAVESGEQRRLPLRRDVDVAHHLGSRLVDDLLRLERLGDLVEQRRLVAGAAVDELRVGVGELQRRDVERRPGRWRGSCESPEYQSAVGIGLRARRRAASCGWRGSARSRRPHPGARCPSASRSRRLRPRPGSASAPTRLRVLQSWSPTL